jgi:hypothetical protein
LSEQSQTLLQSEQMASDAAQEQFFEKEESDQDLKEL